MHARLTITVALPTSGSLNTAIDTVGNLFPDYTEVVGVGQWEGEREPVAIFTILAPYTDGLARHAEATASALAAKLNQQAVLVHIEMVNAPVLIGPKGIL
jgi:hypothetical protein